MPARPPLFVTVEVGTTGARAVAFDLTGTLVAQVRRPYDTSTPWPGWAEQDASEWSGHAMAALARLARRVGGGRIAAIGLTGQTPTVVPVDAGCRPLRPGMLYRDNRATAEAAEMIAAVGEERFHARTGHRPAAFHVGPKLLWLRRHEPDVFAAARWFLQPRDVVLHALTGTVATDESHANATLFFDLLGHRWADDLLAAFDLDPARLPPALPSWTVAGLVPGQRSAELGIPAGTPVVIGAGDSQCAAFGAGVVGPGPVSEMAGASSCLNTAVAAPAADLRITHYSHVVPGLFTTEVGLNTTGAAIRWAVQHLGFTGYADFERAARRGRRAVLTAAVDPVDAAPLFIPHLADGERDDPDIRGGFVGLADRHDRTALAYAVVEGVALAVCTEVAVLEAAGSPAEELRASGGGTRLGVLGQVKADLLGAPVRHLHADASPLGAAMLAAAAAGHGDDARTALAAAVRSGRVYRSDPDAVERLPVRRRWFDDVHHRPVLRRPRDSEVHR